MSSRGKITGSFTVNCYRCRKKKKYDLPTRGDAERKASSEEWKRSPVYGWICKSCGENRRI